MKCTKFLFVSLIIIALITFVASQSNAVILPTTIAPPIMVAPVPTLAPGVPSFWPTALMFAAAPTVPTFTPTFTPTIAPTTPIFTAPTFAGGITWPTAALMLALAPTVPTIGAAFPAAMLVPPTFPVTPTPTFAPTPTITPTAPIVAPSFGFTPLMVTAPTFGGIGGIGLWPTALMLPPAPVPTTGALFPAAMLPII